MINLCKKSDLDLKLAARGQALLTRNILTPFLSIETNVAKHTSMAWPGFEPELSSETNL